MTGGHATVRLGDKTSFAVGPEWALLVRSIEERDAEIERLQRSNMQMTILLCIMAVALAWLALS